MNIIEEFIENNPQIKEEKKGFPNLGDRRDNKEYSVSLKKIEQAWYFYDFELYKLNNQKKIVNLGNGNPIKCKPFSESIKYLKRKLKTNLYEYGAAAGDEDDRELIAQYLIKEGFNKKISYKNIIITDSTTAAFSIILKTIFRDGDVILMTAPNYGLFTFMPERLNARVELIELKKEDNYFISPTTLLKKIKEINMRLQNIHKSSEYVPKVKAFLNTNPHNPMGTVMGNKESKLLEKIGKVCYDNNVFIIDDLIYRDLTYDMNNIAKPIGTINKYFDNTISLFGLSKSYGLAKTRSGFIVANDALIRAFRDQVFHYMDSSSSLQTALLAGAYNASNKRYKMYNKYFNSIIKKYVFNRNLCMALIQGIDSIKKEKYFNSIKLMIRKGMSKTDYINIKNGIFGLKIKFKPESGFFMIVDFTELKKYNVFSTERNILYFLYQKCNIKFLIGQSFSWPNESENIIRISYSLDSKVLIEIFNKINKIIMEVINETN